MGTKYKNISSYRGIGSELNIRFYESIEAIFFPPIDLGISHDNYEATKTSNSWVLKENYLATFQSK